MTLAEIAKTNGTDKGTRHSYIEIYEEMFTPLKTQPITLVEVGVDKGYSLKTWLEYFSQATIIGIDINPPIQLQHPRLQIIQCNQIDTEKLNALFQPNTLDIVIDDASHIFQNSVITHACLFPKLKVGGFYCVEDIRGPDRRRARSIRVYLHHVNYWKQFPGATVYENHKNHKHDDVLAVIRKLS